MSCNWKTLPLGEILELVIDHRGKTPKKLGFKDFQTEGYPVLSAKHVKTSGLVNLDSIRYANLEMYKKWMKVPVQEGDVVLTSEAPMGEIFFIDGSIDYVLGQRLFGLRPKKELIEPRYLMAWLSSKVGQNKLKQRASGSTVQGIKQAELLKIEIDVPPLRTQKIIANNEAYISKKINLNKKLNQTLEQIAQAIFKSWFVDFEPVKAKISALAAGGSEEDALLAAMQAISGKDKAQLTQLQTDNPEHYNQLRTTAELFPSAMQDSELGEIPEGWSSSDIGKEVTVVGGATPSTKNPEFWDGGDIAWTSPRDLSNLTDKVLVDTERKITEAGLAKISSGLLPINTVLMSSRAPVGYLALTKLPVAVNQGYIAMKCEKVLSPEFTLQWCSEHMDEIKNRASGTTFAEISKKNFKVIPVIVPKKEIIDAFSKQVRPLYSKIEINIRKSHSLGLIRDSLLPKLLSGSLQAHNSEVETD
ncbi:MAG: restriction endonuclease subunit S [Idiomarina loihiensis]